MHGEPPTHQAERPSFTLAALTAVYSERRYVQAMSGFRFFTQKSVENVKEKELHGAPHSGVRSEHFGHNVSGHECGFTRYVKHFKKLFKIYKKFK